MSNEHKHTMADSARRRLGIDYPCISDSSGGGAKPFFWSSEIPVFESNSKSASRVGLELVSQHLGCQVLKFPEF